MLIARNIRKIPNYILSIFPSLSKNFLFKALRNKDIKVNGKRISSNIVIQNGDNIDIYIDDVYLFNLPKKISTMCLFLIFYISNLNLSLLTASC